LTRSDTSLPRICPECGTDRRVAHRAIEYERRDLQKVRAAANKIAEDNGRLRLRVHVLELEREERESALRRKISRQAKALARLETRLRELGARPHEGAPDAVNGPEYEREPRDAVAKEMKY
jgi:hypothetical protein